MKSAALLAILAFFPAAAFQAGGAATKKKTGAHPGASPVSGTGKIAAPRSRVVGKPAARRRGSVRSRSAVRRGPPRQLAPTADRYKEIQKALADRGYLKTEPNGVWDSASQEAMKAFQNNQKLEPTGRLTAASLIALGLGPKRDVATAPATPNLPASPPPPPDATPDRGAAGRLSPEPLSSAR